MIWTRQIAVAPERGRSLQSDYEQISENIVSGNTTKLFGDAQIGQQTVLVSGSDVWQKLVAHTEKTWVREY